MRNVSYYKSTGQVFALSLPGGLSDPLGAFGGDALGHAHGRDPPRLRHDDVGGRALPVHYHRVQDQLWHLFGSSVGAENRNFTGGWVFGQGSDEKGKVQLSLIELSCVLLQERPCKGVPERDEGEVRLEDSSQAPLHLDQFNGLKTRRACENALLYRV